MSRTAKISAILVFLFLSTLPLQAQRNLATLVGTVKDPSSAVVPSATATIKNIGTGYTRAVTTDAGGDYAFTDLDVGHYSLTVSLTGFKTTVIPNFELQTGQSARMDVVLQVGAVTQEVTVTTTAPMISTTSSDVGQVVDRGVLENIPLNGRAFWQLTQLTPGANYTPTGSTAYGSLTVIRASGVNVTINGSDPDKTGWVLDGSSIVEVQGGGTEIQPNVDAIQEFKVQGGNMSAEFGRTPTTVTATIKSGTNQFHGDLFEFVRNEKFDARNTFYVTPKGSNQTKDILKRNQFGGVIGGPIRKDKTFFFTDIEETIVRQGVVYSNVVPTAAQRQGDFSALSTTMKNPFNGYAAFPGNQVTLTPGTPGVFSPQAKYFLGYFPSPNFIQGSTARYVFAPALALSTFKSDVKIDHSLTSRDHIMGRYSIVDNVDDLPDSMPALGTLHNTARGQDATIALTHIFNPHWLNELRAGYYRMFFHFEPPLGGTNFSLPANANYQGFDLQLFGGFPQINITNYAGFDGGPSNQLPKSNHIRTYEYADTLTYNSGKHTMKMGMQLYHNSTGYITGSQTQGIFNFVGTYTGDAFGDLLLGLPNNASRDPGAPWWGGYGNWPAWFYHDNYRVTQNLTLNLGVRYEVNGFFTGQRGQMSGFNSATGRAIIPSKFDVTSRPISPLLLPLYKDRFDYTDSLGLPNSIIRPDNKDLMPRIGFAWKPFGKDRWAVRGGYGIFFIYANNNGPNNTSGVPPLTVQETQFNDSPPNAPTRNWSNYYLGTSLVPAPNPNPGQPCPLGFVALTCATPSLSTGTWGDRRMTYTQNWNFTVQHEITSALTLTAAYVGNTAKHQYQNQAINNPAPGTGNIQGRRPFTQWGTIGQYQYGGFATYNAFQLSVVSRAWHGLSMLGNYTYSHCLDDGSQGGGAPDQRLVGANKGTCNLDRTQSSAISYNYDLPVGRGRAFGGNMPGWANGVVGGWHMSGVLTLQSGLPFLPGISGDRANTGASGQRPDRIGNAVMPRTTSCWFFTSANSTCKALLSSQTDFWALPPAAVRYGTAGRNYLRYDGLNSLDFAMLKNFRVTEQKSFEFRAEFFNLANHPTYAAPSATVNSGSGGQVSSVLVPSRQIQFGMKFYF